MLAKFRTCSNEGNKILLHLAVSALVTVGHRVLLTKRSSIVFGASHLWILLLAIIIRVCSSTPFLQSCMTSGQVPTYQRIEETAATGLWNSECCFSLSPKFTFISNIPFAWFGRWDMPGTLNWTELKFSRSRSQQPRLPIRRSFVHSREGKGLVMLNLSVMEPY